MAQPLIEIQKVTRYDSYIEVTAKFYLAIRAQFMAKSYVANIGESYGGYQTEVGEDGETKYYTKQTTYSFSAVSTPAEVKSALVKARAAMQQSINTAELSPLDKLNGLTYDGEGWAE